MQLFSAPAVFIAFILAIAIRKLFLNPRQTAKVPGIGYGNSPVFASWRGAFKFMWRPHRQLWKGYKKHKNSYFKVSTLREEYVLVSEKGKVAEVKAPLFEVKDYNLLDMYLAVPEGVLSFMDIGIDEIQSIWTIGNNPPWHRELISGKLTQNIGNNMQNMLIEINDMLDKEMGEPTDWTQFHVWNVISKIVIRSISQAFVGPSLCRKEEYLANSISYTNAVIISAEMIRFLPIWLKPYAVRLTPSWRKRRLAEELMKEEILTRLRLRSKGKDKPNDLLQWIVDASPAKERTVKDIAERVMGLNFAAIHTTTTLLTSAVAHLAAEPDKYIPILREELLANLEGGRATQKTMTSAVKLDSFLRESGRLNLISMIGLMRAARKDFRFKDGTRVPAGTRIGVPAISIHHDPNIYPSPEKFDGLRFAQPRQLTGNATRYHLASTDVDYLTFGHGKHACPGRFFAGSMMKLVLTAIIIRYDIKLSPEVKLKQRYFGKYMIPSFGMRILVRKKKGLS